MATLIFPKDISFTFYLNVKDKSSFLPQDLTAMSGAVLTVFAYDNTSIVFSQVMTVVDAPNGVLRCDLTSSNTSLLDAYTAPHADRAYLKSKYHATIAILFSDATDRIDVYIDQIYVSPSGV